MVKVQHTAICLDADGIRAELALFEARYGMSSAEFLERWLQPGDPSLDTMDGIDWAGLCYLAVSLGVLPETEAVRTWIAQAEPQQEPD